MLHTARFQAARWTIAVLAVVGLVGCTPTGSTTDGTLTDGGSPTEELTQTDEPITDGKVPTEEFYETEEPETGSEKGEELEFWVSVSEEEQDYLIERLIIFTEETGVQFLLNNIPAENYLAQLTEAVAAGEGPDLASLTHKELVEFYEQGYLSTLSEYSYVTDSMLPHAVESSKIGGELAGVPWARRGCAGSIENLVVIADYEIFPIVLIEFLTDFDQQQNMAESGVSLASVNTELYQQACTSIASIVETAQSELSDVLGSKVLNAEGSLLTAGMLVVPLTGTPDSVELESLANGQMVVVGAIIILEDPNALEAPVESIYALQCDTSPLCEVIDSSGSVIYTLDPIELHELDEEVQYPLVTTGSLFCVPWDSRAWCFG